MLQVQNITKKYGSRAILKDITFTINPGERVAIVGRNGCGKTTMMQILSGSMRPNSGSISFFGNNPLKKHSLFKKYCGYVPQNSPLLPELTVKDNLKLWGVDKCKNYDYILDNFELRDILKMPVKRMSGGMNKRLSIACAIATWPPILLLDEPTTALDLYYKESIQKWLSDYSNIKGIVLMSTHEEAEIEACDRCLFMKNGRLTEIPHDENMMSTIREYLK